MMDIVLATRNAHKVSEIARILDGQARCFSQLDFHGAPTVVEDADTFAGNATKKADAWVKWLASHPRASRLTSPFFVLADDSGLEVDALGGAPGVHSARFAAAEIHGTENSPDADNNDKLMRLLANVPVEKRTARFRCVLALASSDQPTRLFDGTCEGRIALAASGNAGFGYDPLFLPEGYTQSFAELGEDVKNRISHRAGALAGLRRFLDGVS